PQRAGAARLPGADRAGPGGDTAGAGALPGEGGRADEDGLPPRGPAQAARRIAGAGAAGAGGGRSGCGAPLPAAGQPAAAGDPAGGEEHRGAVEADEEVGAPPRAPWGRSSSLWSAAVSAALQGEIDPFGTASKGCAGPGCRAPPPSQADFGERQ